MRIGGLPKGAYATKLMHSEREPLSLPLSGLKMTRCFFGASDASQVENKFVYEALCQWWNISLRL